MLFERTETPSFSVWPVWLTAGAVALAKAAFIALTPMRALASMTWLIDDSFIEMKVARNLALGQGFSLDGIHPTTGAPFFWIYLSSLNHLVFSKEAAIRATLIETAFIGALAAVVLFYLALKLLKDARVAWTAFLLATFTANAFFNALNGMDTAIFTLFVLMSIAMFFDIGRPKNWSAFAWGSATGLAAGITTMIRGDGLFLFVSLVCVKLWQWRKAPAEQRRSYAHSLLGLVIVAGLCFGAFMSWQLVQTGSPFPGNQVGRRELALAMHNFSFADFSLKRYAPIVVWNVFQLEDVMSIALGGTLLALVAFVSGTLQKNLRMLGAITFAYLGIFFALLVGYQWYFANLHGLRYVNPAVHILFIFIAYALWQLPIDFWKKGAVWFLTLCIIMLASYKHYQMCSRLPWAKYMTYVTRPDPQQNAFFWGTIDWIRENLPAGAIVGVRDYGRISLFTDVRVQDLAGNIDPQAAEALNDGTLKEYLKERKVEYLYIPSLQQRGDKLYQYLHKELSLKLVKEAPPSPTQHLYKVIW